MCESGATIAGITTAEDCPQNNSRRSGVRTGTTVTNQI